MSPRRRFPTVTLTSLLTAGLAIVGASAFGEGTHDPVAREPGRTELVELRTSHSRTFRLADGDRLLESYAAPVHERSADGRWEPIDPAVHDMPEALISDGAAGFAARLPHDAAAEGIRASVGHRGVSLRLRGARGPAKPSGTQVVYADALDGVDARYTALADGLKEELVLADRSSPRVFDYDLRLDDGLSPRLKGGAVQIREGDREILSIPAPFMYEQSDAGDVSHDVRYELDRDGTGWRLRVAAGDAWLDEPARQWPVVVDPTMTAATPLVRNCSITKGNMNTQVCGPASPTLNVGQLRDYWRTFIKFETPALPPRSSIVRATMTLNQTAAPEFGAETVRIARVLQDWNTSLTWKRSGYADWPTGGSLDNSEVSVPATTFATAGLKVIDVTSIANEWYADLTKSFGLAVSGSEALGTGLQFSSSASATSQPKLQLRYEVRTRAGNVVESPTEGQQTARRIKLQAKVTDTGLTHAVWEYKKPGDAEFSEIPLSAVRDASNAPVTSWATSITTAADGTKRTNDLTLDVTALPGINDGPLKLRAYFLPDGSATGTTAPGGATEHKNIRLYRKDPAAAATSPIGPGTVNLLTGNFTLDRTDVTIQAFKSDLMVSRTYNSRGANKRTADLFGPGWESSVGADGPAMPYRSIYNFTEWEPGEWVYDPEDPEDPDAPFYEDSYYQEFYEVDYAVLEMVDGSKTTFRNDGSGFYPESMANDLALSRVDSQHLELVDGAGNITRFESAAAGQPEYKPISYHEPAATNTTTLSYSVVGAGTAKPQLRLAKAFAPTPASAPCNPTNDTGASCRSLTFEYATATTATATALGDFAGRLKRVVFRTRSPTSGPTPTPYAVAEYRYDEKGRLRKAFDPRLGEALGETYTYDTHDRLATIKTGADEPWTMTYAAPGAADDSMGRLSSVSRPNLGATGVPDGSANITTLVYDVPLSGTSAPHQMGAGDIDDWSQSDVPTDATAIFPPHPSTGAGPGTMPDYRRATIVYMDREGRTTNGATPGGGISTVEHDRVGNVIRELTPANRHAALNPPDPLNPIAATSAARAELLDTQHQYDGADLIEKTKTLGPLHAVKVPGENGANPVRARNLTITAYDENAPTTTPATDYHLPTTVRAGAVVGTGNRDATLLDGSTLKDVQKTTYGYTENGTNRGWNLREASEVVVDADGLKLKSTTLHHEVEPLVVERRTPAYTGNGLPSTLDENVTRYYYYGAEFSHDDAGVQGQCGNREYWYGLVCLERTLAPMPTDFREDHTQYDHLLQPSMVATYDARANVRREERTEYDTAGRIKSTSTVGVLGMTGTAVPTTTTTYDAATGRPATVSDGTRTISYGYDRLGRQTRYTDATGNLSTTSYDRLDRPVVRSDGKGSQTTTYDAVTGRPTALQDSSLGTFTPGYDAVGQMVTKTLPNGLTATTKLDESGAAVRLTYNKTTNCTTNCVWLDETVTESIHGQWVSHSGTLSSQSYTYDGAGRLTRVADTPAGQGCTTREYTYDRDSNRTKKVTIPPLTGGGCNTNTSQGSATTHTYDAADRLTDAGIVHDGFGRVTKLPAAAAAGHELNTSYYVNDLVKSQTQNGVTNDYTLDPAGRTHARATTVGGTTKTETYRYASDSDEPAWISEGSTWTRYVPGLDGDLVATEGSDGANVLKLSNLHGDTIADASLSATATGPTATYETDEFGVPRQQSTRRYGYLGGKQRSTEFPTGISQMGVRSYVPAIGRFLSTDPVAGGSANDYDYANQDPVNNIDLTGTRSRRQRIKDVFNYFNRIVNWGPIAAAAIAGNFMVETGGSMSPRQRQQGGGPGIGLAQWSRDGSRWAGLKEAARSRGADPFSLRMQCAWAAYEMDRVPGLAIASRLRRMKSVRRATRLVMEEFERPSVPHFGRRLRSARRLLRRYG